MRKYRCAVHTQYTSSSSEKFPEDWEYEYIEKMLYTAASCVSMGQESIFGASRTPPSNRLKAHFGVRWSRGVLGVSGPHPFCASQPSNKDMERVKKFATLVALDPTPVSHQAAEFQMSLYVHSAQSSEHWRWATSILFCPKKTRTHKRCSMFWWTLVRN